jgi:molybdopterin converting factor subunit 1
MKINVLFFGITRDLIGKSSLELELEQMISITNFKLFLIQKYPQLENLNSYAIAVNEAYATDDFILKDNDCVAIIPPVSGG